MNKVLFLIVSVFAVGLHAYPREPLDWWPLGRVEGYSNEQKPAWRSPLYDNFEHLLEVHSKLFEDIENFLIKHGVDALDIWNQVKAGNLQVLLKPELMTKIKTLAATFLAMNPSSFEEFNKVVAGIESLMNKGSIKRDSDTDPIEDPAWLTTPSPEVYAVLNNENCGGRPGNGQICIWDPREEIKNLEKRDIPDPFWPNQYVNDFDPNAPGNCIFFPDYEKNPEAISAPLSLLDKFHMLLSNHVKLLEAIDEFLSNKGVDTNKLIELLKSGNFNILSDMSQKLQPLIASFLANHPDLLKQFNNLMNCVGSLYQSGTKEKRATLEEIIDGIRKQMIMHQENSAELSRLLAAVIQNSKGKRNPDDYHDFLNQHKELLNKINDVLLQHGIDIKQLSSAGNLPSIMTVEFSNKLFDIVNILLVERPELTGELLSFLIGLAIHKP